LAEGVLPVGIVVLNWSNAPDTTRCLESLQAVDSDDFRLYLVDNGSPDGSADRLLDWLRTNWLRGPVEVRGAADKARSATPPPSATLIRLERNLGYAGGNNAGIERALSQGCQAVWILNNDTTVAPDVVDLLQGASLDDSVGVVGSCVLEQNSPEIVQCLGGGRYRWARSTSETSGGELAYGEALRARPERLDYIYGAAMLIPASTVARVGLLNDAFFLYCEEIDYAERCKSVGLRLIVEPRLRVWHRFGGTIGSSRSLAARSPISVFHGCRSALILVSLYRLPLLPVAIAMRIGFALQLLAQGRPRLARAAVGGIVGGLISIPDALGHRPQPTQR
jgi:GT2 family glycosyltransferase